MANIIKLYEDNDYILSQKTGVFGLKIPLFCSYFVTVRSRAHDVKMTRHEKSYLLATLTYYIKFGGDVRELRQTGFFRDFCEAVGSRSSVLGKFFFQSESPKNRAIRLVDFRY
jgi:hypothetical protein